MVNPPEVEHKPETEAQAPESSPINEISKVEIVESPIPADLEVTALRSKKDDLDKFRASLRGYNFTSPPGKNYGFANNVLGGPKKDVYIRHSNIVNGATLSTIAGHLINTTGLGTESPKGNIYLDPKNVKSDQQGNSISAAYTKKAFDEIGLLSTQLDQQIEQAKDKAASQKKAYAEFATQLRDLHQEKGLPERITSAIRNGESVRPPATKFVMTKPGTASSSAAQADETLSIGDQEIPVRFQNGDWKIEMVGDTPKVTRDIIVTKAGTDGKFAGATFNPSGNIDAIKAIIRIECQGWAGLKLSVTHSIEAQLPADNMISLNVNASWDNTAARPKNISIIGQRGSVRSNGGKMFVDVTVETPVGTIVSSFPVNRETLNQQSEQLVGVEVAQQQSEAQLFKQNFHKIYGLELLNAPEKDPNVEAARLFTTATQSIYPGSAGFGSYEGDDDFETRERRALLKLDIPQFISKLSLASNTGHRTLADLNTFPTIIPSQILEIANTIIDENLRHLKPLKDLVEGNNSEKIREELPQKFAQVKRALEYAEKLKKAIEDAVKATIVEEADLVVIPDNIQLNPNIRVGYTITRRGDHGEEAQLVANRRIPNVRPLDIRPGDPVIPDTVSQIRRVVRKTDLPSSITTELALPKAFVIWADNSLLVAPDLASATTTTPVEANSQGNELEIRAGLIEKIITNIEGIEGQVPKMTQQQFAFLKLALDKMTSIAWKQSRSTHSPSPIMMARRGDDYYADGDNRKLDFYTLSPQASASLSFDGYAMDHILGSIPRPKNTFADGLIDFDKMDILNRTCAKIYAIRSITRQVLFWIQDPILNKFTDQETIEKVRGILSDLNGLTDAQLAVYFTEDQYPDLKQRWEKINNVDRGQQIANRTKAVLVGVVSQTGVSSNEKTPSYTIFRVNLQKTAETLIAQLNADEAKGGDKEATYLALAALCTKGYEARVEIRLIMQRENISFAEIVSCLDEQVEKAARGKDEMNVKREVATAKKALLVTEIDEMAAGSESLNAFLPGEDEKKAAFLKTFSAGTEALVKDQLLTTSPTQQVIDNMITEMIFS